MNERIKELFQEAIDYADKTHTYTPEEGFNIQVWDKIRFEKFAELIVRECVKVVDDMADPEDSERYFWAIQNASKKIKDQFGVAE